MIMTLIYTRMQCYWASFAAMARSLIVFLKNIVVAIVVIGLLAGVVIALTLHTHSPTPTLISRVPVQTR